MKELKLLLACGALFGMTAGIAACDVEDGDDGGVDGDMLVDATPDMDAPAEYTWVIIVDDSAEPNLNGTPGADICGLTVDCGGTNVDSTQATAILGDGEICDGSTTEPPCESGTDRGDPNAALDTGANCAAGSSPSDYISIGVNGQLAVQFAQDLQGCNVVVTELEGGMIDEPYQVYICQTDTLETETCLNMGAVLAESGPSGGQVSVDVPAAE